MNRNVIHDTVQAASAALAARYKASKSSDHVRAMHGDSLPIGSVPLVTQGEIDGVSLAPLGPAFYQVETHKLLEYAAIAVKAVGSPRATARAMGTVYPGIDTRALQRLHPFAPLVHIAAHYAGRMNGQSSWDAGKGCFTVTTPRLKLRVDENRVECNGFVRRSLDPMPDPELILARSSGHTTRTFPNLGAVYRAVAIELPELAQAAKLLITVAYLSDTHHLIAEKFDIERCNEVAKNRTAWVKAYDAVSKSRFMPWKELHTLLKDLVDPWVFHQKFLTGNHWATTPYLAHDRERHMEALLDLQTRDLHQQKFPPDENDERQRALHLIHLQQQVR